MSFNEKIAALVQRLPQIIDHVETEEATKNALVMPFISALGYDVFNPKEVIPEYTADVGTKKGEKVDYAILKDEEVVLIFECKKYASDLGKEQVSQLYRYFSVTHTRIGVLTNGVQYRFFSDLDKDNVMDSRPFLEFDLNNPKPNILQEVRKLAKDDFDLDQVLSAANELKYTSEIRKILAAQYESPSEDFVRFFFSQINPGARFVGSAKEMFTQMVGKGVQQFINEKVSDRLRTALETESAEPQQPEGSSEEDSQEPEVPDNGIVTTEEELSAHRIIQAIATQLIPPDRVVHRDAKTYMGILLDNNNRKPICRLWFNTRQKYLGTFDAEKNETKHPIEEISEIYQYQSQILNVIQAYDAS